MDTTRVRRSHADRLRAHTALLDRAARRLVDICAAHTDVRGVYAFGSYASGTVRLRSDLDVLVVRDTSLRRADRDLDIRRAFDVPVGLDLLVLTPAEVAEALPTTSYGRTILASLRRLDAE